MQHELTDTPQQHPVWTHPHTHSFILHTSPKTIQSMQLKLLWTQMNRFIYCFPVGLHWQDWHTVLSPWVLSILLRGPSTHIIGAYGCYVFVHWLSWTFSDLILNSWFEKGWNAVNLHFNTFRCNSIFFKIITNDQWRESTLKRCKIMFKGDSQKLLNKDSNTQQKLCVWEKVRASETKRELSSRLCQVDCVEAVWFLFSLILLFCCLCQTAVCCREQTHTHLCTHTDTHH